VLNFASHSTFKIFNLTDGLMTILKRILIAEDDPNDLELTMTALSEYNLANQVDVVHDGADALDYLFRRGSFADRPEGEPVAVILDLKMPKVDGLEVLRQIKEHPDLRTIPVVMLTSSSEERDLVQSYQLGVNAFVVKPVGFEAFMRAIKAVGVFWALVNEPYPYNGSKSEE
jgi:CheY-like chemotaxis protein